MSEMMTHVCTAKAHMNKHLMKSADLKGKLGLRVTMEYTKFRANVFVVIQLGWSLVAYSP